MSDVKNISDRDVAFKNLEKALQEYSYLFPAPPAPVGPPEIVPKVLHTTPGSFHAGYNMMLDSGGAMPNKIKVVVVPSRPDDVKKYSRFRSVKRLLKHLKISDLTN